MLLIQASNGAPILGLADDKTILWRSDEIPAFEGSRDYGGMLEAGLAALSKQPADLSGIAVDIGPGGLGVTRTAVSFCNALAFGLGLHVIPLPAFDLLGHALSKTGHDRVALLRRAGRPFVHFAVFEHGELSHYEHCDEDFAIQQIKKRQISHIGGNLQRDDLPEPLLNTAPLETLRERAFDSRRNARPAVYPIVEDLT